MSTILPDFNNIFIRVDVICERSPTPGSVISDSYFFKWTIVNTVFRSFDEIEQHFPSPITDLSNFQFAIERNGWFWKDDDAIRNSLETRGHRSYYIDTFISKVCIDDNIIHVFVLYTFVGILLI